MPMTANEPWLLRFLAVVKTRPGMWVPGPETVSNLQTYLCGYRQARGDLGLPAHGEGEEELLDAFGQWMARRLKTQKQLGWAEYVQEVDSGPRNIITFFELFEEFLSSVGKQLPAPQVAGWPADTWGIGGNR
jgi:hypothetical protein